METTARDGEVRVAGISQLRAAGLTENEIAAIDKIREKYDSGYYRELTDEIKRLEFAKWLFEHGMLKI